MPGPKKKPTALSIIQGNPGKRSLNKNEPKPKAGAPRCPVSLSDDAKKHWRTIVKQLAAAKIMTKLDSDALALYCEAYARWNDANQHLQKFGIVVKSPQGWPIQSPYLSISNRAFDQMKSMLGEFGMTPASRTKITTVDDNSKGGDPWSEV